MQVHSRECKVQNLRLRRRSLWSTRALPGKIRLQRSFVAKISIPRPFWPPFWHREVSAGTQEKWPFWTVYAHFSPLSEVATERLLYAPLQRI